MELDGKAVLVTGAQQGIGRAVAIACAAAGADVAINWLDDRDAADSVAAAVRAHGRRALPVQADVGTVADGQGLVAATVAEFGRIDVLVNNAGVFPRVAALAMTEADWDLVHGVNLRGAFFVAQAAARAMVAAGRGGAIVNMTSRSAGSPSAQSAHYASSKAGLIGLTRALALELAPHRIRVNAVAPGLTDTAQPRYGNSEADIARMAAAIPVGRIGRPEDIAEVAVFLASERAAFVTGQTWHVNGGALLR